jgi:hypothetical protein
MHSPEPAHSHMATANSGDVLGSPSRRTSGIAVKQYAHHRNEADRINDTLQDPVDELVSPLKGRRRSSVVDGPTLAEKMAAVPDRTAKRNVAKEEKKRYSVRRRVVDEIGTRGVAFRQAFKEHFSGSGSVTYREYKQKMQTLGVVLSDEDFRHLWDSCSQPQAEQYVGQSEISSVASAMTDSAANSSCYSNTSVSVAQLAETVGITLEKAFIGSKDKEKERKCMKKAAIVGQKLANHVKGRKNHLRQALLISDVGLTGMLSYQDFKSCLSSVGILLSDSDCQAVVAGCVNESSREVLVYILIYIQIHKRIYIY